MSSMPKFALVLVFLVVFSGSASAARLGKMGPGQSKLPQCLDLDGNQLEPNNEQVLAWKTSTPPHWQNRGYVLGTVSQVLPDKNGHLHLDVNLGGSDDDMRTHVEIIYNFKFGDVPEIREGAQVAACGDYITANRRWNRYPPSPMGAIVHWVHMSPRPSEHASGFLAIDGVLYGNEDPRDGGGEE